MESTLVKVDWRDAYLGRYGRRARTLVRRGGKKDGRAGGRDGAQEVSEGKECEGMA
jgi:hypothetical protein